MRNVVVVVAVLLVAGTARADTPWDGTYAKEGDGGGELCPHLPETSPLTVAKGTFSIAWNIRAGNDALIRVGTIEGTVRDSGLATATAKLLDPMPREAVAALEQMNDSVDKLRPIAKDLQLSFASRHHREISLATNADCYVHWSSKTPAATVKKAAPALAPKLPPGAAAWDGTYLAQSSSSDDWRCPRDSALSAGKYGASLRVANGRFVFPYVVDAEDGRGLEFGEVTLGQVDGTIAANGKVTVKMTLSVSELPPEITRDRPAGEATLDGVRTFMAGTTMAFSRGKGAERTASFAIGHACGMGFVTESTFRPGSSVPAKASVGAHCNRDNECASDSCEANRCQKH